MKALYSLNDYVNISVMVHQFKILLLLAFISFTPLHFSGVAFAETKQGSVGIEGKISSPPPSSPATISIPGSGQSFSSTPVTVGGICPKDTLVKLFKNGVFAGSVQCTNGSFSLIIDLFDGQNNLVARVYDALDQVGPDSNTVVANFIVDKTSVVSRVSLTSPIAKKGAFPGDVLSWPITLSDGAGPYALSIDWGDGKTPDLLSRQFPGDFNIEHKYDKPGVYNIIIRATDKNGGVAYLQLVGVANGSLSQQEAGSKKSDNQSAGETKVRVLWQPAVVLLPLIVLTFWLGKKHQIQVLRKKIERGERPF